MIRRIQPALAQPGTASRSAFDSPNDSPTDQIIVKYTPSAQVSAQDIQPGSAWLQALNEAAGVPVAYFRPMSGDAHVLKLAGRMPVAEAQAIADRISALPEVEYAVPDRVLRAALAPNDPMYASQWDYYNTYGMNLPDAWSITTGSPGTVVAVIDTGRTPTWPGGGWPGTTSCWSAAGHRLTTNPDSPAARNPRPMPINPPPRG